MSKKRLYFLHTFVYSKCLCLMQSFFLFNILHILMFKKKNDDFLWNNKNIE